MPHKLKLASSHYQGLRPRTRADRCSALVLCAYGIFAIALVLGLRLLQTHWQTHREAAWSAAPATILDVRPVLVAQSGSAYGRMLYNTQVLVALDQFSGSRQLWITLRKLPTTAEAIQQSAIRWKGAQCIVRWNPANPTQIDADIS